MVVLPPQELDAVWASLMRGLSKKREAIPINKNQLKQLLGLIDSGLSDAEVDIVQAIPVGPAKSWLVSDQDIGRWIMVQVMLHRLEAL